MLQYQYSLQMILSSDEKRTCVPITQHKKGWVHIIIEPMTHGDALSPALRMISESAAIAKYKSATWLAARKDPIRNTPGSRFGLFEWYLLLLEE